MHNESMTVQRVGKSILIVDDTLFMRKRITKMLAALPYKILEASDGIAAEKIIKTPGNNVVLMITDIHMPGQDGLVTVANLRKSDPDLPIIVCSSLTDRKTVLKAANFGVREFVAKPVDEDKLLKAVYKYISPEVSIEKTVLFFEEKASQNAVNLNWILAKEGYSIHSFATTDEYVNCFMENPNAIVLMNLEVASNQLNVSEFFEAVVSNLKMQEEESCLKFLGYYQGSEVPLEDHLKPIFLKLIPLPYKVDQLLAYLQFAATEERCIVLPEDL